MADRIALNFRKKLTLGLAVPCLLAIIIITLSLVQLRRVIISKDLTVMNYADDLIAAERLRSLAEGEIAADRGLALLGDETSLDHANQVHADFDAEAKSLQTRMEKENDDPKDDLLIAEVLSAERIYEKSWLNLADDNLFSLPRRKELQSILRNEIRPRRVQLDEALNHFISYKRDELQAARSDSENAASRALMIVSVAGSLALVLAGGFGYWIVRDLNDLYLKSRRAIRDREDVMAIVSHDLKNPLSAISLSANLAGKQIAEGNSGQSQKLMQNILDSATAMNRLIQSLLDLSRIEAGLLSIDSTVQSSADLIHQSIMLVRGVSEQKEIQISSDVKEPSPRVLCDRERILQVLTNLLTNAIKFTDSGGTIQLAAMSDDERVIFSVKDTGRGIPRDQLASIFDRYQQARPEDRRRGTGLGLYIVKGIIEAHRGKVWVESEPGRGSTFFFELPRIET